MRRDLNGVVGGNGNWKIPRFWPLLLRYISAPILAIIFGFAYPEFYSLRYDPMMISGFILAHCCLLVILLGVILPRYYDIFIPPQRRAEGTEMTVAFQPRATGILPDVDMLHFERGASGTVLTRKHCDRIGTHYSAAVPKP